MLPRAVSEERKETKPRVSTTGETGALVPAETWTGNFRGLSGGQEWEEQTTERLVSRKLILGLEPSPGTDKLPESIEDSQRSRVTGPGSKSKLVAELRLKPKCVRLQSQCS